MGEGDPTGGSLALAGLIDQAGEALIPDLKYYYGIDLRDLFSEDDPLSPSWALLHVNNLPMESATVADLRGGENFRGWNMDRYMTARLIDSIQALKYVTLLAHRDPKKKAPPVPEPFPLPDKIDKKTRDARPGSFASVANNLLAKAKKRKEGGG